MKLILGRSAFVVSLAVISASCASSGTPRPPAVTKRPAQPVGLLEEHRGALEATLREIAEQGRAGYGVYFKDLTGGATIRLDADRVMHAASLMKAPILLEVLRRADAAELRLDEELEVANEFKSIVDGSPFSLKLDPSTDGPTMARLGAKADVEFLAREMIVRSSNLATNVLLSHVGAESVQKFADELGAPSVKVRRCLEDGKAYEQGINNETDAAGMGVILEAALRSPRLSAAAHAKAWQILTGQTFNDQIPAGIPKSAGAIVGHKTGFISSVQHDAALVHLRDGRDYVLVILATDFGANDAGRKRVKQTSRRMSRAVFDAMSTAE